MKALVSPNEIVNNADGSSGWRVAQVVSDDATFAVADPLFWGDCPEDCVADTWYYNPDNSTFAVRPAPTQE